MRKKWSVFCSLFAFSRKVWRESYSLQVWGLTYPPISPSSSPTHPALYTILHHTINKSTSVGNEIREIRQQVSLQLCTSLKSYLDKGLKEVSSLLKLIGMSSSFLLTEANQNVFFLCEVQNSVLVRNFCQVEGHN